MATLAIAQTSPSPAASPGRVTYIANSGTPNILSYLTNPLQLLEQWFQSHIAAMIVYPPMFDASLSWFPNGYAYFDLYGIQKGSWEELVHPEWILHDQSGNRLYLPYNCSGGTCAQYAADVANPAFRAAWIADMAGTAWGAGYPGVFIDDVNMNFQVGDGSGTLVAPVDSNTGQPMTYDAWRNYVAGFLEQARTATRGLKLLENTLWYAGPPGVQDADPAIQRQIATADTITLERGVASDTGLSGGTGGLSVYAFLNYVDRVHAAGKGVNFQEYALDPPGQEYGLASYFLISNGSDSIGDASTTPDNWWPGYDVDLGTPLGPRTYQNGIFERDFTGGKVLLGEPGLAAQTVDLGGLFARLDGTRVSSVSIGDRQGYVLVGVASSSASPLSVVVNAASQTAGPASPGEVVTLTASSAGTPAQVFFNGVAAPVVSVAANALNAVVPFGLDLTHAAQVEIRQDQSIVDESVSVAAAAPGIFTTSANGSGPGAILNQDYSLNTAANPAAAGSVIMVYATGFGALNPPPTDGSITQTIATTLTPVTATIGGFAADVLYAGAAPGLIEGVTQINVRVPAGAAGNPAAAISLTIGAFTSASGVTVSVQ
ncbi:MAG TPA: putative glycoside hydrolase [Bryobacteraceae bacterium]|nr:putative glycoside hydrolase [Bryobacteraceae bacterium]